MIDFKIPVRAAATALLLAVLAGCAKPDATTRKAGIDRIDHIIVIYAENRGFDHLYGLFPGANGIANASPTTLRQVDRDGSELPRLPPVWKGNGRDSAFPTDLPNRPFRIDVAPVNLSISNPTPDLVHRIYQNQEQINGGRNDRFVAVSDEGALTMGYYDGSVLPMWSWAEEYVLSDNFFMGAFGGSYLNHFWLVCACTPLDPDAPANMRAQIDAHGWLKANANSPPSVLTGPPKFLDGSVTPDGFSVNSAQPRWQPSGVPPTKDGNSEGTDP